MSRAFQLAIEARLREARVELLVEAQDLGALGEFSRRQARLENKYATTFAKRSARRVRAGEKAGRDPNTVYWEENRFMFAHMRETTRRMRLSSGMDYLRTGSPKGAFWLMDMRKRTHTPDCVLMNGKNWSWEALRVVNPANRHAGCGCQLLSWMDGGQEGDAATLTTADEGQE